MAFTECGGTHHVNAQCWRCSDKVPWWRDVRIKAGLGAEPPQQHPNWAPAPAPPVKPVRLCIDCGIPITKRGKTGRCQRCYAVRSELAMATKRYYEQRATPLGQRYGTAKAQAAGR